MSATVLVGYDGSDESRDALSLAEALARMMDGRLLLANVERVGPYDFPPPSVLAAVRERAERLLAAVAEEVRARGHDVDVRPVLAGSPARGLHELAERETPDLVVVGSSHHGRVGAVLLGTVGVRLLHGSPCPVAIAPRGLASQPDWVPRRIGVGYDGSPEAEQAVRCACAVARHTGTAAVHILVAAEPVTSYVELPTAADTDSVQERARERLHHGLAVVDGIVAADGEIVEEAAAAAFEHASTRLDLLVLGSRGYGPLRRGLLGSVSSHLARTSACPLIVTPRGSAVIPEPSAPPAASEAAPI